MSDDITDSSETKRPAVKTTLGMMKKYNKRGYDYININTISKSLICKICKEPFDNPYEYSCGHAFCEKCLNDTRGKICEECNKPVNKAKPVTLIPFIEQLDSLKIECKYCTKSMLKRDFETHIDMCDLFKIDCEAKIDGCKEQFFRKDMISHNKKCLYIRLKDQKDQIQILQEELDKKNKEIKRLKEITNTYSKVEKKTAMNQ